MSVRPTARRPWRVHALVASLAVTFAGAAALTAPAQAAPAAVASASGVEVVTTYDYVDEYGMHTVLGTLRNVSGRTLENVRVVIDQTDANHQVLASTVAPVLADRLDTGEASTFEAFLGPVPGVVGWSLRSPGGDPAVSPANHRFTTTITGGYTDEVGLAHTTGTVRNDNTGPATYVSIGATFFNGVGNPVGTDLTFVDSPTFLRLAGGEVGTFDVVRYGGPSHSSMTLFAEAGNDPSPLPTALSITTGGGSIPSNRGITVTGRVVKSGTDTGAAGVDVVMDTYSAYGKTWVPAASGTADGSGNVRLWVPPQRNNTTVRLRVPGTATVSASESGTAFASVTPVLELSGSRDLQIGSQGVFHVDSPYSGTVQLQRKAGKRWVTVGTKRLKQLRKATSQTPPYEYHYVAWMYPQMTKVGKFQFRAVLPVTALNGVGISNTFTVKVIGL